MHNQQQRQDPFDTRTSMNLVYFLAKVFATCFTVFTRHTFGQEALGWNGLAAFFLIPLWGGHNHSREMLQFWYLWLIALVLQRIRTFVALARGAKLHSQFAGRLWLGSLFHRIKSYRMAVVIEIAVCFLAGAWLETHYSRTVGGFVMGGAGALLFVHIIEHQAMAMELRRMRDSEIEMQNMLQTYQNDDHDF